MQYDFALGEGNTLSPRINYGHISEQWATLFQNEARGDRVEARDILNAQIAWKLDTFVTTLYGTNLTDQHYVGAINPVCVSRARRASSASAWQDVLKLNAAVDSMQDTPGRSRLGGARGVVLRLRAEFPRPAAAVDPRQADPGRARRHRRPARPDQRPLFRAVLLLDRDSGRLARGPDQPGEGAVASPARSGARRRWPAAWPQTIRSWRRRA